MTAIHVGDCLEWLRTLPDCSVDSCVTDPPYGLGKEPQPRDVLAAWLSGEEYQPGGRGFMGQAWDAFVPSPPVWAEIFRVLKPGGHLLAFAGSRTYDWIALGVRLAGFEVRDQLLWLYGSGFPKSHNLSKALDRAAGADRKVIGTRKLTGSAALSAKEKGGTFASATDSIGVKPKDVAVTAPATEAAKRWEGWGTALKPAHEPIVMARKPFAGTVAANVERYGTGAINVDACRVGDGSDKGIWPVTVRRHADVTYTLPPVQTDKLKGRWPANVIHDGSPEVVAGFPGEQGESASRFFYCAKASRAEREAGLAALEFYGTTDDGRSTPSDNAYQRGKTQRRNVHPTVKPVALIRYLQRLVTPLDGLTIDPYLGSGTAAVAAEREGFRFAGCERETRFAAIAYHRWRHAAEAAREAKADAEAAPRQTTMFGL